MSILRDAIQMPIVAALGWALFHFLWQGALIAAVLAALLLLVRPASARVRYGLAAAALFAMPLVFLLTAMLSVPESGSGAIAIWRGAAAPLAFDASAGSSWPWWLPRNLAEAVPWIVPLWAAGVFVICARQMGGWFAAQRFRWAGVPPLSGQWGERLRVLAVHLGIVRFVSLLESPMAEVPVTLGLLRPVILLPVGLVTRFPAEHLEYVLLHELAHIRRRDYLVNLVQSFVEGLLFYHPAVWWISETVRAERENCCDDIVLAAGGNAPAYAAALAALEQGRTAAAAPAATGGNLMRRIRRMLGERTVPHVAAAPVFAAGMVLAIAAVALAWQPRPQTLPVSSQVEQAQSQPAPAPAAQAEKLPAPFAAWLDQDVVYIITREERRAFERLATDAERYHFIEQFWLRRDPTPGTPRNEFKEEHYRRIAYANQRFAASNETPGWRTDRGRTYIVYGPPDEIEDHSTQHWMVWRYRSIEGVGADVIIGFTDLAHTGDFRMTRDPHGATEPGTQP